MVDALWNVLFIKQDKPDKWQVKKLMQANENS